MPLEGYKWPYYDSYVPNLGMKDLDKKIVRRGIQRQYFPNDAGNFNEKDLKRRKQGIKKIEHQYIDRIKSASSPRRRVVVNNSATKVMTTGNKYQAGLFKQHTTTPGKGPGINITAGLRNGHSVGKDRIIMLGSDAQSMQYDMSINNDPASQTLPADYDRSQISKTTSKKLPIKGNRRKRPINDMIEKLGAEEEALEKAQQSKLKFPLLKNDDTLDDLLYDMLGPDEAKKLMYGSDHASVAIGQSDHAAATQRIGDKNILLDTDADQTKEVQSQYKGKKSVKSKSTIRGAQEANNSSIIRHGTDAGRKSPKKTRYDSTRPMNANKARQDVEQQDTLSDDDFGGMSDGVSKLQRKLVSVHDLERYCKPQQLSLYNPIDSGFKYNLIGLFGIPEEIDPLMPCVYTVVASVFPPGDPYKEKPYNTMFGANYFANIDFDRSMNNTQLFQRDDGDIELAGIVLKLADYSVLVFDIKKFDLRSGEMTDYGFAFQPLIHTLKKNNYLIGGRYQMPVYRGSLPRQLMAANKLQNLKQEEKPRVIFKKLLDSGRLEQMGDMQLVSQISDLNPPDDQPVMAFNPIPSMLHHFDKTDLEKYSLEEMFSNYDDEGANGFFEQQRFAPQLTKASVFKTTADVVAGAKTAFKKKYLNS